MLKRWTVSPLQNEDKIRNRLDAVEELVNDEERRRQIQQRLRSLPDIERILTKIYTYSVKQKVKAFWIEIQARKRLEEFFDLLNALREIVNIL